MLRWLFNLSIKDSNDLTVNGLAFVGVLFVNNPRNVSLSKMTQSFGCLGLSTI
jgi:hypothetical protein